MISSRRCLSLAISLLTLSLLMGCEHYERSDVLPRRPDDVSLVARNLRYDAGGSGYTFSFDEKRPQNPCEATKWVYIRKDALVGTQMVNSTCIIQGDDLTRVWLRSDWGQPDKPITRQELENIPSLNARNPGR